MHWFTVTTIFIYPPLLRTNYRIVGNENFLLKFALHSRFLSTLGISICLHSNVLEVNFLLLHENFSVLIYWRNSIFDLWFIAFQHRRISFQASISRPKCTRRETKYLWFKHKKYFYRSFLYYTKCTVNKNSGLVVFQKDVIINDVPN